MATLSKTSENYLRAIYELTEKKGYARPKDLTIILEVSSASVTEMLQKLSKKNLINYEKRGAVTLTESGKAMSVGIWKRHDTFRKLLELAGVAPEQAYAESSRIKHNLSPKSVKHLLSLVGLLENCEEFKKRRGNQPTNARP
jgi:DtxR family Mn-dependent transcriptional regulator